MAFPTQSIDFEQGSNQYAEAADSASLSVTGNLTIEAWIKIESIAGSAFYIASKWLGTGNQRAYIFRIQPTTMDFLVSQNGSTNDSLSVSWTPSLATWYHVAVSWTASTSVAQFFVDGVQQGTDQTGTRTAIFDSTDKLYIGALEAAATIDGRVGLTRLWAEARTGTQINTNKFTVLGSTTNLKGEWTLDNVYTDNSGNSNTLTGIATPVFSADVPGPAKVVVVAGGGGGGNFNGGGGAGGYKYHPSYNVVAGSSYTVTVGDGGNGSGSGAGYPAGTNGGNSVFDTITSTGGGYGGTQNNAAATGGSGGGGASQGTTAGAAGTAGQGYAGGNATALGTYPGGGGGGAGAVGANAADPQAGAGGVGVVNPISGSTSGELDGGSYWLAGGGGAGSLSGTAGAGGKGGGGDGSMGNPGSTGGAATANTGGGGGGAGNTAAGGAGGKGVVIIAIAEGTMSATGGTKTTAGGNDIWTFTSSGTFTVLHSISVSETLTLTENIRVNKTPTTWSTTDKDSHIGLSGGNLVATGDGNLGVGWFGVRGTTNQSVGKKYFEVTLTAVDTNAGAEVWAAGLANDTVTVVAAASPTVAGIWSYNNDDGNIYANGSSIGGATAMVAGDVLGVAYDSDAGTIDYNKNGAASFKQATSVPDGLYPVFYAEGVSAATINVGNTNFAYTIPSGFSGWDFTPITTYTLSVSDALTITESTTSLETSFVSVSDAVTNTESVSISNGGGVISVVDTGTIVEDTNVTQVYTVPNTELIRGVKIIG